MRDGYQSWSSVLGNNEEYNPFNYPIDQLIDIQTGKVRSDAELRYNEDWLDELTADNPLRQEYVLSASGGSKKTKYMYSLGYLNEEGILKTTQYERFTGRINLDTELHEYVKGGLSLNYARGKSNSSYSESSSDPSLSATSNVFYSAQLMAPIYPFHQLDQNGKVKYDEKTGQVLFDYGYARPPGAQQGFNSIATLYDDKYETTNDNVSGRTYLEIGNFKDVLEGLKLTVNLGMDQELRTRMTYYNPYFGNATATKGRLYKSDGKLFSYTTNQLLNYNRKFDDHRVDILIGHEFYNYTYNFLAGDRTGFPFGGSYELDAAANVRDARSYKDSYAVESILSRFNYDYRDKYYFSGSFRRDASSRFYKKNRWGDFWSVGGSWRISEEDFMVDYEQIDNLTLKASYGIQGNDNVGELYAWQAFYDLTWPNSTLSGALAETLENKTVTWEKNSNFNTGIEFRAFDRIGGTIEWYQRVTKDMLLKYPMPISSGYEFYFKNVGKSRNRGLEITLYGDIIKAKDFSWRLTFIGSTINNKVISLGDNKEIISGSYIIREGEELNSFYTAVSAGVNPETGNQLFSVWEDDENGDRRYFESESITLATQSKKIAGSRIPDIYGSFSNEFRYKNFDLNILCTYSLGGKILDSVYRNMTYSYYVGQSIHADLNRAWRYPGDKTDIPRPRFSHNYIVTDKDLINASYLSLKNITLGYSLPSKWVKKVGSDAVRVFATGDNLLLFSHLKGMDPQYNFTGGTNFVYSPVRVISFGIDVKF
jgi:TonB-linked SusC/RagA family outer membrane protein